MIWHIFKKDWNRLWPLVAIVAAGRFLHAALWIKLGHFEEPHELISALQFSALVVFLGWVALIVILVHQDMVPGDRQDWLVRPIRRRDLLLAKLSFLLIAIQGPHVLANMAAGLFEGFPFDQTLAATLSSNATLLVSFGLAIFAGATITRTTAELIGGALVIVIVVLGAPLFTGRIFPFDSFMSGMTWMQDTIPLLFACVASAIIVPLQYFRRATLQSRGIVVVVVLFSILFNFLPWSQAFALQQWFASDQAAANQIALTYDPALGRSSRPPELMTGNTLLLPLHVTGLGHESIVKKDRAEVRLIDDSGSTLYRGVTVLTAPNGKFDTDLTVQTVRGGDVDTYQQVTLPQKILERVRDQPVRLEIDYFLTLFQIDATLNIAAFNGNERTSAFGWCKSKIDDDGDEIEVGCLKAGSIPTCVTGTLENRSNGVRNPDDHSCRRNYDPSYNILNALSQAAAGVHFRDPKGLAKYPVDGSQLSDAQVSLKSYQPVAHFTRQLVIPEIRLSDWEAEAAKVEQPQK